MHVQSFFYPLHIIYKMNIDVINLCMSKPTREHSSSLCYVFNDGVRPKNSIKSGIRSCQFSMFREVFLFKKGRVGLHEIRFQKKVWQ